MRTSASSSSRAPATWLWPARPSRPPARRTWSRGPARPPEPGARRDHRALHARSELRGRPLPHAGAAARRARAGERRHADGPHAGLDCRAVRRGRRRAVPLRRQPRHGGAARNAAVTPIRRRLAGTLAAFGALAAAACLVAPLVGSTPLAWSRVFDRTLPFSQNVDAQIFFLARLPRVLAAAVVGATLPAAGGVFQALLRNPLATPFTLG